jgi:hypothetical protein
MKILVKAIAGSHLFGTNTPTSDKDFKGVFLPSAEDILLGKFDQTIHQSTNPGNTKNTKDDVDVEFYSLDKFLKMLFQGQTVAWELLFTPDEMILEKHPLWDDLRLFTPQFLNKKVDAFVGYCKQQAHKYGVRGSRMNSLEEIIKILDQYPKHFKLGEIGRFDIEYFERLEHVEVIADKNGKELLSVCGKKFGWDTKIDYALKPLKDYYENYGERTRLAKQNEGIDWKALSHAVRVCMQAISLLERGYIQLPMSDSNVQLLKQIKAGELPFGEVADLIEFYQDQLKVAQELSILPPEPNKEAFNKVQIMIYEKIVKGIV